MKKIAIIFCMAMLALGAVSCKCPSNYIFLASDTTVGFDVSEAASTSTPQATLAYKRSELAIVPCTTNGVAPNVLMDFQFKTAIFTSGGGIWSRIATGDQATTQQPALLMMSSKPFFSNVTNTNK